MKYFIVCFGDVSVSPVAKVISETDEVEVETKDGGEAYRRISKMVPDVILFDGDRKPGHVAQTLKAILELKIIKDKRIVIVSEEMSDKIRQFSNMDRVEIVAPKDAESAIGRKA